MKRQRVLIFVIAYYADTTLREVLERIPRTVLEEYDCEVLVVDDASQDRTFEIGREFKEEHPELRMTVLRNELNQGYGGNQKIGYSYAISEKFDLVAMVHGDGQYAPEALPRLLEPLSRGEADAVFGSRMLEAFGALKGGMPLYKFVGNRILSTAQNFLLGTKLSEFHSGYRVYSIEALMRLPFLLNSNDYHFDTEIIIQLLNAGQRIVELPIPTYYGNEICRVNGMKYAKDVMLATVANTFHRSNLLYQRRFDTAAQDNSHYELKLGYPSSHSWALDSVPAGAKVMDIGSGPAGIAAELVKKGCDTTVVDQHAPPAGSDESVHVVVQDLDDAPRFDTSDSDYVLMLDIIEHLRDPEQFLARLRAQFDNKPKRIVITTPNIAFVVQRLMLLFGQFNYGKQGILDRTHTRLFTFRSLLQLLDDAGFKVKSVRGVPAPFPKVLGEGLLGSLAVKGNLALIALSRTLFSYQIFVEAEGTPGVEFILADTKQRSGERAVEHKKTTIG